MSTSSIASAELAQPAWTYPICVYCGAAILPSTDQLNSGPGYAHNICPDVEDLNSLPLVERAAIACSMYASDGCDLRLDDGIVYYELVAEVLGEDACECANRIIEIAEDIVSNEREQYALAESMLRNGEIR